MNSGNGKDWRMTLVILADDELSATARTNIEKICRDVLNGCRLEILDASNDPEILQEHQIFAIPTLIREKPEPVKKIVGSLSNRRILLQELGIQDKPPAA